ncbi:MAG: DNA-directed RNA polymerase subunit alpha C-terminal domain-containing protein [Bacteroidales bacterium]|nr:DNA-directed RNA polymerase subunit alpha C-terminal domain-containing protein [Bacteroidales bacterium]
MKLKELKPVAKHTRNQMLYRYNCRLQEKIEALELIVSDYERAFKNLTIDEQIKSKSINPYFIKVGEIDFTSRTKNCLKHCEINNLGELTEYMKSDLFKWRNLGKKSINEIEMVLNKLGFGFKQ